jgi:putative membrane protein
MWHVTAGALTGLFAGLAAAWAMNLAQSLVPVKGPGKPATVHAAQFLRGKIRGKKLPHDQERAAGNRIHYAFGALLGAAYGAVVECWPRASSGLGIPFGLVVTAIADEALVPALGFAPPPWRSPAKLQAYGAASHILFGAVAEAVRKILRPLFQRIPPD